MKNFKVLFMLAGLSTGLVASEGNGSADFMNKFAAQLTSFYNTAATKASDATAYVSKNASEFGAAVVAKSSAAGAYVSKSASDATTAISNSSAAQTVSAFGSSVAKNVSEAATVASTKASEFGSVVAAKSSQAAAYVSQSATASYDSSAKFCEENPTVVVATLFTATVVTFLAYMKYQQDGYLFYANEEASQADQA